MQHSMLVLLCPGRGVWPQRYGQAPVQHIPVCFPLHNLLTRSYVTLRGLKRCAARQHLRAAAAQTAGVAIEEHASFNCATLNILAPIYKRTARCTCILCMCVNLFECRHQQHHHASSQENCRHACKALLPFESKGTHRGVRGRESNAPEDFLPRNKALVDLLLERRQDVYCLQVLGPLVVTLWHYSHPESCRGIVTDTLVSPAFAARLCMQCGMGALLWCCTCKCLRNRLVWCLIDTPPAGAAPYFRSCAIRTPVQIMKAYWRA